MKKKCIILYFILAANLLQAQTENQYSYKLQGIYGNIIPHDSRLKPLIINSVKGAEFSLEFQTMGEKSWQQFQNFPIVGLGGVWLNLGNPEKLGNAFAIYPYLSFPLIRTNFLKLNIKAGAGASYLTKTYYNTNKDSLGELLPLTSTNLAIGSHLNVYFSGGGSLEIPISKGLSLTAEYTWNHMSNGIAVAPNTGLNLLNGFIGLKYLPSYKKNRFPVKQNQPDFEKKITFELIGSSGFRQLYYADNKTFPIGSIVFSAYHPIKNFMRMGLGVDAFYDGVYGAVYISKNNPLNTTKYAFTYIASNELKNKIRVGISWQNELLIGKLTAGFHLGLYLYNPIKNLEPFEKAKNGLDKPLIYTYNINEESGWFYTRASVKYALSKHIFVSIGLKTHLQKAEFIEWGLGYRF